MLEWQTELLRMMSSKTQSLWRMEEEVGASMLLVELWSALK